MMYSYPFFTFPTMRRTSYYSSYPSYPPLRRVSPNPSVLGQKAANKKENYVDRKTSFSNTLPSSREKLSTHSSSPNSTDKRNSNNFLANLLHQEERDSEEPLFELFGIKLYSDDILLLCLIFFLYQEEVKDQYLFFSLILLLLS